MTMSSSVSASAGHRRFVEEDSDDSRSSCSLGRDSDEEGVGDFEVGSSGERKGPLDTMDSLEEALPTMNGISKFYQGKSKSFTSLADASRASSIEELAKPEIPFARKRNPPINPLARTKTADTRGSSLAPELTMTCPRSINNEDSCSMLMQSSSVRPPLHPLAKMPPTSISRMPSLPQNFNCRSFSLSDIRSMAGASSND